MLQGTIKDKEYICFHVSIFLGLLLLANLFTAVYVFQERTLYFWDFSGYWAACQIISKEIFTHPFNLIAQVWHSIQNDDYNLLPTIIISSGMNIVGSDTRLVYVLMVLNLYGGTAILCLFAAAQKLARERGPVSPNGLWMGLIVSLLAFPGFLWSILIGFLDVGGVIIIALIFSLYFRKSPEDQSIRTLAAIGFLIAILCLFRRWYIYWAVSFFAIIVIDCAWSLWNTRSTGSAAIWYWMRPPFIIGLAMTAILAILATPLIRRVAYTDYRDMHSAYMMSLGRLEEFVNIIKQYGGIPLSYLAASGIMLGLSGPYRRPVILLILHLIFIFMLFTRVQDHNMHHMYLYYPTGIILITLWVHQMHFLQSRWRGIGLVLCAGLAFVVFMSAFVVRAAPWTSKLGILAPSSRFYPVERDDIPEVIRLLTFLDSQIVGKPTDKIYVLASSWILSDDVLRKAGHSLRLPFRSPDQIPFAAQVDKRDGFPRELLEALLVVTSEPVQYHLAKKDQQVMGIPAESLLDGKNIGKAFLRIAEFQFTQGVKVFVYEKTRPFEEGEIQQLCSLLKNGYPDRPIIYTPVSIAK